MPISDADLGALGPNPAAAPNLAGVTTIQPQAAASAITSGKVTGAPAAVMMFNHQLGEQAAQEATNRQAIAGSKPVANFAGTSATNAAVAQGSLPQLANVANMASDFSAGVGKWWDRTRADALADFIAPAEGAKAQVAAGEKEGNWGKLLLGGFGLATSLPAGLFNSLIAPASRGAAQLDPYVPTFHNLGGGGNTALGELGVGTGLSGLIETAIAGKPLFESNEAKSQRNYANIFNSLLFLAPGPKLKGAAAEAGDFTSTPHVTPDGPSYTPSGHTADANGNPVVFATPRDAAQFIREHGQGNTSAFTVHGTNEGYMVHKAFDEIPVPGTNPAADAAHLQIADMRVNQVQEMQEEIAGSQMHQLVPEKTEEFLEEHSDIGGKTVYVDPKALINLREAGEEVFPEMGSQIVNAAQAGQEVPVPMSKYLAETAGKSFAETLNAATRFDEEGVSQEQGKALPKTESAVPVIQSFETVKGSTYTVEPDGTTTRIKSFHPEHGEADQGLQPTSSATYYVTPQQANEHLSILQADGPKAALYHHPESGALGVVYQEGAKAGQLIPSSVVQPHLEPRVGSLPIEVWNTIDAQGNKSQRVHFGNPITKVNEATKTVEDETSIPYCKPWEI